jgi:phosphatidate cytidylyltransferase
VNRGASPTKQPSNLAVRLATTAVGVPLILLLLYKGPTWSFFCLVLPIVLIAAWEFFSMTHPADRPSRFIGLALSAAVATVIFLFTNDAKVLTAVIAIAPLLGTLVTLIRLGDIRSAALRACAMGFGPLFVAAPLTWLAVMRRDIPGNDGPSYVVLSIMFAWLADSGGYFAGRFLGKHKLYEAVSPKKTIEGAAGGLAGALLGAFLASFWFLKSLPIEHAIPLALVAGALGQAGDLGESLLKRSMGVKDSGAIVPGHGGILDRIDALMLTGTIVYLYTRFAL